MLTVRAIVACAAVLMLSGAGPASAQADVYPNKPIRVIVPWPAGGLVDILARTVGERLQTSLGQPVVVENRTGAGGSIGADAVAMAAPDGYTLALTTTALNMNAALRPGTPAANEQFAPVAVAAFAPSILVIHPSVPANNVRELIAVAKAKPNALNYASAGNGSPAHLQGELFKALAGVDLTHVPYKGAPQAISDQIAGRVQIQFANAAVALPQIKAGTLRPLAVTSASRWPTLPELPTMDEAGVAGFEASQWLGYLAPRETPASIVTKLNVAVGKAISDPAAQSILARNGMEAAVPVTPEKFAALLKAEFVKWSGIVRQAGIKLE
jgi:tripartite-type tricarboxylate transporter receptor subunit TctC